MNTIGPTKVDEEVNIPIIDIDDENETPRKLLDAASKYGFIFVKHSDTIGLKPEDVDTMFRVAKELFHSEMEIKENVSIRKDQSGKYLGYLPVNSETLDPDAQKNGDFKEAFNIGAFENGKPQQPLPPPLQASEEKIGKFINECHSVCHKILKHLATALKIPEEEGGATWFSDRHDLSRDSGANTLRLNYYPAIKEGNLPDPTKDLRAGAHSDYGSITLLFRLPGQPGLEIKTPSGAWATVPTDPDPHRASGTLPILVNIGDLMAYWTNGLLKSTVHRVVFPRTGDSPAGSADRYSIAYFCHPMASTKLVEIPSYVVQMEAEKNPRAAKPQDKTMTAIDHLNSRLAATIDVAAS